MSKQFTLYYREKCHLCDSMRRALVVLQKDLDFDWVEIDIDRDTDLIWRYDTKVPVLNLDTQEICYHFYDEQAIRALF